MNNKILITVGLASVLISSTLAIANFTIFADSGKKLLKAKLDGFHEVAAVSSTGSGSFAAQISPDESSIAYELSYSGLEADITQVHIHFGQAGVNGGVVIYLCQTQAFPDPTGLAPSCPHQGTIKGTLNAANLVGVPDQLLIAGEFDEFVDAMQAGVTYVNVHTEVAEGLDRGEIRGQIS